jgi:MFS family permease
MMNDERPQAAQSRGLREAAANPQPGARSGLSFAALRNPDYRVYFIATALAMMADNIEHVISYWVLFERFKAPWLGGVAVLTHWLPFLFFSVASGALADRFDNRRIIQAAMGLFMLVSFGWAVLFLTDTLQPWHAVVLLTIHGLAGVLWGPASQLLVHDIVGVSSLQSAVRLNATSRNLGILMGPAVGGGLMLLFGPAVGLFVNVLIYLPLVLWLWKAPYGMHHARQAPTSKPRAGPRASIALIKEASSDRTIIAMIALAGAASFFVGTAYQVPEYAHHLDHDHTETSYSVLLAAGAAGAFFGGVILESRSLLQARPRSAMVLTILWSLAIGGFAMTNNYPLAVALMFVAGFLYLSFSAMAQTLVQVHAPAHLRGRLIGLFNMSSNGLRAFSGITVGFVGSLIGIHWSLALSALVLFAVVSVLLAFSIRRA